MLTAYFLVNINYEEVRKYFYHQFYEHLAFRANVKRWQTHTNLSDKPQAVSHLRTVHPSQNELFCLRILLLHQKGFASWNYIKTAGITYTTFKAACIALDIIESDQILIDTMDEACAAQLPSA
jgi:hypothetical protein